jgi:hypothetical protein
MQEEDNFQEYPILELGITISRPATWKMVPAGLASSDSILLAIMFKRSERSRPSVTLLVHQIPPNIDNAPANGKEYVESNIMDLTNKHEDFDLMESAPSTLGGNIAHQAVYLLGGAKHFSIATIKGNKIYNIVYRSNPEEYSQYLPVAEKMVESFQYVS